MEVVTNPTNPAVAPQESTERDPRVLLVLDRATIAYISRLVEASGMKLSRSSIIRGTFSAFSEPGLRMPGAVDEAGVKRAVLKSLDIYTRPFANTPVPRASLAGQVSAGNAGGKSDACSELDDLLKAKAGLKNPHLQSPAIPGGSR